MDNLKQSIDNNKIDTGEKEPVFEVSKKTEERVDTSVDSINKKIYQKEEIISEILNNINKVRLGLGLSLSDEIPPSVEKEQNIISDLKQEKSKSEGLNFIITEPKIDETPEEYISRLMNSVIENKINNDENSDNTHPLLKNRSYYGKRANKVVFDFFSSKENSNKIKDLLFKLDFNNNKKLSNEKNDYIFNELKKKISSSSRESASGDDDKKTDYYYDTNQERDFFSYGSKYDAYSYSSMMFGLPENFIQTEEGKEYLHNQLDDKIIFLFGGGDSIKDLLKSEEFKPKKVINFDPYLKEESFDKNPNGIYESQAVSASDKKIREMTDKNEIPKADEVWATYSVPFYLDSSEDIRELILNMSQVLNEDGNARIYPLSLQSTEKDGESFETRKQSLITSIKELIDNPGYNVTIFNDTLKIHKIKKEDNE